MMMDRRTLVTGLGAGAVVAATGWDAGVSAQAGKPLFAGTALANNAMARHFQRVDIRLPDVPVITAKGLSSLSGVGGKTRLIALWAEWCVPCLVEIRDFAALRPQVAGDRFDIGLVLTASSAKLDFAGATARLQKLGAGSMPLLIEPYGGKRVAQALASRPVPPGITLPPGAKAMSFSLPCTLLVDARGRVRGRAFGAPVASDGKGQMPVLTDEQKAMMAKGQPVVIKSAPLTEAEKDTLLADGKTAWSGPAGLELMKALAGGILDRV